jgi:hypothetical protein
LLTRRHDARQVGAVDFGASDVPLTSAELQKLGLCQFPIVIGGVVAVVNIGGRKRFTFSPFSASGQRSPFRSNALGIKVLPNLFREIGQLFDRVNTEYRFSRQGRGCCNT